MNSTLGTLIVALVVAAIVALIIIYLVRSKRKGKCASCSCGCGCNACDIGESLTADGIEGLNK